MSGLQKEMYDGVRIDLKGKIIKVKGTTWFIGKFLIKETQ